MEWKDIAKYYGLVTLDEVGPDQLREHIVDKYKIQDDEFFRIDELVEMTAERAGFEITLKVRTLLSTVVPLKYKQSKKNYLSVKNDSSVTRLLGKVENKIKKVLNNNNYVRFHYNKHDYVVSFKGKPVVRFEKLNRYEYQFLYGTVVVENVTTTFFNTWMLGDMEWPSERLTKLIVGTDLGVGVRERSKQWLLKQVTENTFVEVIKELDAKGIFNEEK